MSVSLTPIYGEAAPKSRTRDLPLMGDGTSTSIKILCFCVVQDQSGTSTAIVKLTLILPLATASVKRDFSVMNIVKNPHHNMMGDQWLNDSLIV
ncbi:hypothetical protein DVH24_003570 [Malus domestica]|uniref:HAT C-terminal dimerisation domain-containing protein n=1 Tax=Malus domestica TaxID=3750 RepID=A0A498IM69_MALDO|nr:hypothetical protein DVH24_003570 [Malus domestica]